MSILPSVIWHHSLAAASWDVKPSSVSLAAAKSVWSNLLKSCCSSLQSFFLCWPLQTWH